MDTPLSEKIKVVAFDADDTLWLNEPYFRKTEQEFCSLLSPFGNEQEVSGALFRTEMANMERYGYGIKAFTLSMVETAVAVGGKELSPETVGRIIALGKKLLEMPVVLMEGVEETLDRLSGRYTLVIATKGDLLDQQSKLMRSGLAHYFDHTEIMPDKTEREYRSLIGTLGIPPQEFLMIGNSLRSDILPVLSLGGNAIHIPAELTWQHETADATGAEKHFRTIPSLTQLKTVFC